ncbi:MAG: hypothetical protein HYY13_08310 [Nitrospirae bacterium]|nr:hypothetical protein [Nitrospirota bacterium]
MATWRTSRLSERENAEQREQRVEALWDQFNALVRFAKMGDYEAWIMRLHLAFGRFREDWDDVTAAPVEYERLEEGDFKGQVFSRRTGFPRYLTVGPGGVRVAKADEIEKLRRKYPRLWWVWDCAERTSHLQFIPRHYIWQRGGVNIHDAVKLAILIHPDTTKEDVGRAWKAVNTLKRQVYNVDVYPRSKVRVPFNEWPDIVRGCEKINGRGKYAKVARLFTIKRDTVKALYQLAKRYVFSGPPEAYQESDRPDAIEEARREDANRTGRMKLDPIYKPRLCSYVKMTPEQRQLKKQADALLKQSREK